MAWDKNGKAMLSDPVKEGDNKWTEKEVFGADILSYISNRYDTEAEYGYEAGTSQATMVAERVKLLFDETEGRPFTIHLLFRLEYYLKNSMGAFVVGDKLTIADVAWFPHVFLKCVPTIDSGLFPHVREWYFRLAAVSDVRKGAIGAGWGFEDQRFLDLLGRGQAARDGTV
ncbi:hypothetical protein BJY00DRAFT_137606 [Aspergillus carlsbadensis]|nr:hypothetical protein BJY00DRAFT_137606 [Aspergillus carlsbadensis]